MYIDRLFEPLALPFGIPLNSRIHPHAMAFAFRGPGSWASLEVGAQGLGPSSDWAPLVAIAQMHQARSSLATYALCHTAAVWDIIDDQPASRGRGRGETVGKGPRPGGKNRAFVDFKNTKCSRTTISTTLARSSPSFSVAGAGCHTLCS